MFKILILAAAFLISSCFAQAANYQFDCTNAEGTIRVSNQGVDLDILGAMYIPYYNLSGLKLWHNNSRDKATVEVLEEGQRTILDLYSSHACREIRDITFAQMFRIRSVNDNTSLPEDVLENFICRELAISADSDQCDHGE